MTNIDILPSFVASKENDNRVSGPLDQQRQLMEKLGE